MRRVFHPETNGVKTSPHRLKWMLSRGAPAAPSDPWNFDASDVPPRQNGQRFMIWHAPQPYRLRRSARDARRGCRHVLSADVINFAQLSSYEGLIFSSSTKELKVRNGENAMSKKAAEHHKKASEHLTHAAHHHGEAAKHHEAGNHEKAAHHAHTARAHVIHGRGHAEEAVKAHADEHGKK
jgi:hypothetical protein